VGDVAFQNKCLGRMSEVASLGRTVLFVSHNMAAIGQLCRRCILLEAGKTVMDATAEKAILAYIKGGDRSGSDALMERDTIGSGRAQVTSVAVCDIDSNPCRTFLMGQDLLVRITGSSKETDLEFSLGVQIATFTGIPVLYCFDPSQMFCAKKGGFDIEFVIHDLLLLPGSYFVHVWIGRTGLENYDYVKYSASFEVMQSARIPTSYPIGHTHGLVYGSFSARQVG